MKQKTVRRLRFLDEITIDTVPFGTMREQDVVTFTRGGEHCPDCSGQFDDDVASMIVGDWRVRWCCCGCVWVDKDGEITVLADLSTMDEQAAQDRAFDAGIGYGG